MLIRHENLTIRNAADDDAEQLCAWWNDGKVMSHAGLPNGVGCTPEEIRESLAGDTDETHRRHIIELDGKPIGEMNYRNKGGAAELGIKICDFSEQEKGYGTKLLTVFIDALFRYYGYEKMILDTNLKNERAQHVYEKKLGFRRIGIEKDSWRDQLGELQSTVNFEMSKADWFASRKELLEYVHIPLEDNLTLLKTEKKYLDKDYLMQHWSAYIYDEKVIQDDVQHILSIVGATPLNILEVACGSGRISIPLAQAGHSVTGFDIDEFMLERIPQKANGLSNLNCFKADAVTDDWGNGFDVVILSGNVLVNVVTDGDYRQAQELFIQKAASCVKQGGHLYLDFDCVNWPDSTPENDKEWVCWEGTDDLGTYGRYIVVDGEYDSKTRIDKSRRRYEIIPKDGEMFTVTKPRTKHFPTYEQVISWLDKYGWEIEWQSPVSKESFFAVIWAKKK